MQLSRSHVPDLARKMVKALAAAGDIEIATQPREVERDLESVMTSYLEQLDRAMSRARDLSQQRGLPQGEFARIKKLAAEQAGIKVGDEALDYLLDQLVAMLMTSANVDEVFAADHELRARMRPFLLEGEEEETAIEAEVRGKLKHVQEGSRAWEIEYQRIKEDIRRRRGL